jgi:NAD(P)-dependent dehydrogenase (short-subunit alcohol dehydrogenase family)
MSEKRVVLVTGASAGIGKSCAEFLAAKGFRVYGASRGAEPGEGGYPRMLRMDVTDNPSVELCVREILRQEGRIDAVFNNAGIHVVGPLEEVPMADLELAFQTNCLGAIRVCRAVLPAMRVQGGGAIINMSSIAGIIAVPFQGAYCGSKFALEGMTEAMRGEVKPFGVRVSLIEPGDIRHQDCHLATSASQAYEPRCSSSLRVGWADEEKGYPPERIGPLVLRILDSRSPRLRYTFGPAYQSVAITLKRRLLSDRLGTWAIGAYYKA